MLQFGLVVVPSLWVRGVVLGVLAMWHELWQQPSTPYTMQPWVTGMASCEVFATKITLGNPRQQLR
jgi:hypothetical protein